MTFECVHAAPYPIRIISIGPVFHIRPPATDLPGRRTSLMKPALLTTMLFALAAAPAADARVIELGATAGPPPASCPDDCQAVGRVTGYQLRAEGERSPFKVTRRGKVVAFSITLGEPRRDQIEFFDDLFGGPAKVRLSILRPGTRKRHRLTGQSEVFEVRDYFGSTPTFALSRPLTVRKGYIVAITAVSWVPTFAVSLAESQAWRSSRDADKCDDVRQNAAQQTRKSLRTYGCVYRTARLMYTATFVPDPRRTTPKPNGSNRRGTRVR